MARRRSHSSRSKLTRKQKRALNRAKFRSSRRTTGKSGSAWKVSQMRAGRRYRSNPMSQQFSDGTSVSIDGRSVTISTRFGETYEYDEVSASGLQKLQRARTGSAARKACDSSGILRSINPKRGRSKKRRTGRKSRRWTVGATKKQLKALRGKGRLEKAWPFKRRQVGHGRRTRR